jgi:hypothetical protein
MDTTFDSKHAGREIRALIDDLIAEHGAVTGTRYGSKRATARALGVPEYIVWSYLTGSTTGASEQTVTAVCGKLGVPVAEFMADTSYARSARKGRKGA